MNRILNNRMINKMTRSVSQLTGLTQIKRELIWLEILLPWSVVAEIPIEPDG